MDTVTTEQDSTPSANTPNEDKDLVGPLENSDSRDPVQLHTEICKPCPYFRGFTEDKTTVKCSACNCTGVGLKDGKCPVRRWGSSKPGSKEEELGLPAGTWITGKYVVKNARHNPVIDEVLNANERLERVGACHWLIK